MTDKHLNLLKLEDPVVEEREIEQCPNAPVGDQAIASFVEKLLDMHISDISGTTLDKGINLLRGYLDGAGLSLSERRTWISNLMVLQAKPYTIRDTEWFYHQPFDDVRSFYSDKLNSTHGCDRFVTLTNLAIVLIEGHEIYEIHPEAEVALIILQGIATSDSFSQDRSLCHLLIQLISAMEDQTRGFNALSHILSIRFQIGERESLLHDDPFEKFYKLSEVLQRRGEKAESALASSDLDAAITCLRLCSFIPPPETANYVKANRMLGTWLLARYQRSNNMEDLNESTKCTVTMERKYDEPLLNMSRQLSSIFGNGLGEKELVAEIELRSKMLLSQPVPHPGRAETLLKLGSSLTSLCKTNGNIQDVHTAIMHLREARHLAPDDGLVAIALGLALLQKSNIGRLTPSLLLAQSDKSKERSSDLDETLNLFIEGSKIFPFDLASSLKLVKQQVDSKTAIAEKFMLNARNFSSEHEQRDFFKQFIAEAGFRDFHPYTKTVSDEAARKTDTLRDIYSLTRDISDLDERIDQGRKALSIESNSTGSSLFFNVGEALYTRYQNNSEIKDLDEALEYLEKSLELLPLNNFYRAEYLTVLAKALAHKARHQAIAGETPEAEAKTRVAIQHCRVAATESHSSPITNRLKAAALWAWGLDYSNTEDAIPAYEIAIGFLPKLSPLGSTLSEMQGNLQATPAVGIGRLASLYVIRNGNYGKAVEFLETGRAVFWQQVLKLRTPTHGLKEASPELYEQFLELSTELEKSTLYKEPQIYGGNADRLKRAEEIVHLGNVNERWEKILGEIQSLDGFSDFLSPQKLSDLQKNLSHPVIYLIPNESGSHALILLPDDVKHVLLPGAPYSELQRMISLLQVAHAKNRGNNEVRHGGPMAPISKDHLQSVLEWLWKNVVSNIIHTLELRRGSATENRIFWCPTGVFSFLPLHAAGIYRNDMTSIDSIFDYAISSYTPTAGVISKNTPKVDSMATKVPFKMMVVIDSVNLSYATVEMEMIKQHIPLELLQTYGTDDSPALVKNILKSLPDVSIAHFACHGKQHTTMPLYSSLQLHDYDLTISAIMEKRMQNASLAFLCACETAKGDPAIPDEEIHLGATLLFSGFKNVVATMWPISDDDGPVVADKFYEHLMKDNSKIPNTELSAEALHVAITELRRRGVSFYRWVPFIHLGN